MTKTTYRYCFIYIYRQRYRKIQKTIQLHVYFSTTKERRELHPAHSKSKQ